MLWKQMERAKEESKLPAPCVLWPVELKLTHCSPEETLVQFQGQYMTICELDYNILQVEIQNAAKSNVSVQIGDVCLVENATSGRWYRGKVQNIQKDLFHIFLLDHGDVLIVGPNHLSSISDTLLMLPPKIVCGFFANILPVQNQWDSLTKSYFSSLIGCQIKGYIHARLPYHVLILEAPDINSDLIKKGLGRHVDTNTFLLLVEMLIEEPISHSNESVPDLLIEKQTGQECCLKSSSLLGFEEILSLNGAKLKVGQNVTVVVAAAVNPGLFYCRLSSVDKDLQKMSDKLALACESSSGYVSCQLLENLGLLCAVKGKDEKWHRGFVECLPLNSQVRVVFVDSGYCESVKVENILQLPSEFFSTPIMAFPCSLSCLEEQDEMVKSQQLDTLKTGLLGQVLEIAVDDFNKDQNYYLVTLSTAERHSDEQALVNQSESMFFEIRPNFPYDVLSELYDTETKAVQVSNSVHSETVAESSFFEGYVMHVQSPNHFWMRTKDQNSDFENMMKELTEYFSKLQLNEEVFEDPVPGALCCAMYVKDLHYYRALVVDTLEQGAEVFFIDFGNIEKVPSNLIKRLPRKFSIQPKFVLECSLAHVAPFDDLWTSAASDFFRQVTSNKTLMVHVIHRKNGKCFVDLFEEGAEDSRSIATIMTTAKMALDWSYNPALASVEVERSCNEIKGKGNIQKKKQNWKNPQVVTFGKVMSSRPNSNHMKPDYEQKSDIERHTLNKTPKPEMSSSGNFKPMHFKPGSELSVICPHINSPSDFWCQTENTKVDLDRLMKEMQVFYQKNTIDLEPPEICCAVKCSQDNQWYRACILGEKGKERYVILVDFGIVIQEKMQSIQALAPQFFELHEQAFRCSLNLIEPIGGSSWSSEACNLFRDFMSKSTPIKCRILSHLYEQGKGFLNMVSIHTPGQQPNTCLVEKGVAMEMQNAKCLNSSTCAFSFVYSSFNISSESEELVHVTHVCSPWEIYIQLDRNSKILDALMDRVAEESQLITTTPDSCSGNVCLAKYVFDGSWYRALTHPVQSHQHVSVFFVDYGNKQISDKTNVMAIPTTSVDLLLTPMQALRCSLLNSPEGEHLPEVNSWLETDILNKSFKAKFVLRDNNGHFVCELYDGDVHVNKKLKELIAEHDPAVSKPSSDCPKEEVSVSLLNSVNSKAKRHRQTKQAGKQTSNPPKTGCKTPKKEKCQVTPSSLKVERSQPSLPKLGDLPVKIQPGSRGVGFVSHCNSVESFFIQMEDDEPSILQMGDELNRTDFKDNTRNVAAEIKVGDLVAAEYEEDLALYRAVVTNVSKDGHLAVEFIDYGNTTTVDKKNVHMLTKTFLSQPRLSIPCTLVKPHSFENDESFDKKVVGKPLIVEFIQKLENSWEVSIETEDGHMHGDLKHDSVQSKDAALTRQDTFPEKPQSTTQIDSCAQKTQENNTVQQKTNYKSELIKTEDRQSQTEVRTFQQNTKSDTQEFKFEFKNNQAEFRTFQQNTKSDTQEFKFEFKNNQAEVRTFQQKTKSNMQQCKFDFKNNQTGVRTFQQKNNSDIQQRKTELRNNPTVATRPFKKAAMYIPTFVKPKVFWNRKYKKTKYNFKSKVVVHSKSPCETTFSVIENSTLLQENACTLNTKDDETFKPPAGVAAVDVKGSEAVKTPDDLLVVDDHPPIPGASSQIALDRPQTLFQAPVQMNFEYEGFAAAVTTPFEFYIILEDLLLIVDTISSILENLPEVLAPLPEALYVPGTSCLVKSVEKKKWCRAQIVQFESTSVLINLVDYGQYTVLSRQDVCQLKELPEELGRLPKVTYHCLLRGVKPSGQDWSDDAIVFFQNCMCHKTLQIRFRQRVSETQWEVDIITGNWNLAKELVDAGHATYIDNMLGIRFRQEQGPSRELKQEDVSSMLSQDSVGEQDTSFRFNSSGVNVRPVEKATLSPTSGIKQCLLM